MTTELFRTKETSLSGDELLILDVIFWVSVTYQMLRQCNFVAQFNEQSHALSDDDLKSTLGRIEGDGIVKTEADSFEGHAYVSISPYAGPSKHSRALFMVLTHGLTNEITQE